MWEKFIYYKLQSFTIIQKIKSLLWMHFRIDFIEFERDVCGPTHFQNDLSDYFLLILHDKALDEAIPHKHTLTIMTLCSWMLVINLFYCMTKSGKENEWRWHLHNLLSLYLIIIIIAHLLVEMNIDDSFTYIWGTRAPFVEFLHILLCCKLQVILCLKIYLFWNHKEIKKTLIYLFNGYALNDQTIWITLFCTGLILTGCTILKIIIASLIFGLEKAH